MTDTATKTMRLDPVLLAKAEELAEKASKKAGVPITARQIVESALRSAWFVKKDSPKQLTRS